MEFTEILIVLLALILSGLGIVGSVAPALPGPPFNYAALLVYHFAIGNVFSVWFLVASLLVMLAVVAMDYVLPPYITRRFGGTRWGVIGGIIGLVVGLFFSPWGIILGPLLGAIIGDLIGGKNFEGALKSGIGSFVGFVIATSVKLGVSIALTTILIIRMAQVHLPWDKIF